MGNTSSVVSDDVVISNDVEPSVIVWLDAECNNVDNEKVQQKLGATIKRLMIFQDENECEKYIRSISPRGQVLLIVNNQQGQQMVPHIHTLHQLTSIYVYCKNKKDNKDWTNNFSKIKAVSSKFEKLISQIEEDQENFLFVDRIQSVDSSTVNDDMDQSKIHFTPQFAYSQLLSNVLLQIKSSEKDKNNCFALCKDIYKYSETELSNIDEFQQSYTSNKALWWYPRLTFIDKILNKALGTQDMNTIFLFQFFIQDLHQQITKHQCEYPIRVYRAQLMRNDQVKSLQYSVGHLISIDTFFSTAIDRNIALSFLNTRDKLNNLQRVLFEIEANPEVVRTKPFADIVKNGYFSEEDEVLFSIGSVFRITNVKQSDDQVWNIQMTLCGDDDSDLKPLFDDMTENYGCCDGEAALFSFSRVLRAMNRFDEAETYCRRLLRHFCLDDTSLAIVHDELAGIASDTSDHDFNNEPLKNIESNKLDKSPKTTNYKGDSKSLPKIATFEHPKNENNSRYTDVLAEKQEILLPIEGHENMPLVSLEEAVVPLLGILPDIRRKVHTAKLKCKNPANGLTPDQSAAIMLYTMEWEPQDECLYFALNARLRAADRKKLKPWFLYLKLILAGLARLPSIERTVYRGIKLDLSSKYKQGDQFFWWGFSSCTTTINVLKSDQFLGDSGERTLFHIECKNGKDIGLHSYFQTEEEILLLPAIYLEVKSCFDMAPGLHAIQLKEIDSDFPYLEPVV